MSFFGYFLWVFLVVNLLMPSCFAAWTEAIIDSSNDAGRMSIDIDSLGRAHIGYTDENSGPLKYAVYNGTDWVVQIVDADNLAATSPVSLELDSQNHAHMSYWDAITGTVRYASFNGTGWTLQSVTGSGTEFISGNQSLALNAQGYAQITFSQDLTATIHLASYNGTGWDMQTVNNPEMLGGPVSLALNAQGYAQMAYQNIDTTGLDFASYNGSDWVTQHVSIGGGVYSNSLALDNDGYAQISYYNGQSGALTFAFYNGTGWTIQVVDSGANEGGGTSLGLDSQGHTYISYIQKVGSIYNLRLASFNGTGWDVQTLYSNIDTAGGYPSDTSLALYNDYLYIAYGHGGLAMTTNFSEGFVPEPAADILGKILFLSLPVFFIWQRKSN